MIGFWILAVVVFLIITYFLNKVLHKNLRSNKEKVPRKWNIYYWEGLIAISTGLTFIVLFILKSTHILSA